MALSRARLRIPYALAQPQLRPTPHLHFTSTTPALRHCGRSTRHLRKIPPSTVLPPCTRAYSQPPSAVVPEPPDYLNEAELHLFNKIKAALQPVGLKVGDTFVFFFSSFLFFLFSWFYRGWAVVLGCHAMSIGWLILDALSRSKTKAVAVDPCMRWRLSRPSSEA